MVPLVDVSDIGVGRLVAAKAQAHLNVLYGMAAVAVYRQREDIAVKILPIRTEISIRLRPVIQRKAEPPSGHLAVLVYGAIIVLRGGQPRQRVLGVARNAGRAADHADGIPVRQLVGFHRLQILAVAKEAELNRKGVMPAQLIDRHRAEQHLGGRGKGGIRLVVEQIAALRVLQLGQIARRGSQPPASAAERDAASRRAVQRARGAVHIVVVAAQTDLRLPVGRAAQLVRVQKVRGAVALVPDAELIAAKILVLQIRVGIGQILVLVRVVVFHRILDERLRRAGNAMDIAGGEGTRDHRPHHIVVHHHAARAVPCQRARKVRRGHDRNVAPALAHLALAAVHPAHDAADVAAGGVHPSGGIAVRHRAVVKISDQAPHAVRVIDVRRAHVDHVRIAAHHHTVAHIAHEAADRYRVDAVFRAIVRHARPARGAVTDRAAFHLPHQRSHVAAPGKVAVAHVAVLDDRRAVHRPDDTGVAGIGGGHAVARGRVGTGPEVAEHNVPKRAVKLVEHAAAVRAGIAVGDRVLGDIRLVLQIGRVAHAGDRVHTDQLLADLHGHRVPAFVQYRIARLADKLLLLIAVNTAVDRAVKTGARIPYRISGALALRGEVDVRVQHKVELRVVRVMGSLAVLLDRGYLFPEFHLDVALIRVFVQVLRVLIVDPCRDRRAGEIDALYLIAALRPYLAGHVANGIRAADAQVNHVDLIHETLREHLGAEGSPVAVNNDDPLDLAASRILKGKRDQRLVVALHADVVLDDADPVPDLQGQLKIQLRVGGEAGGQDQLGEISAAKLQIAADIEAVAVRPKDALVPSPIVQAAPLALLVVRSDGIGDVLQRCFRNKVVVAGIPLLVFARHNIARLIIPAGGEICHILDVIRAVDIRHRGTAVGHDPRLRRVCGKLVHAVAGRERVMQLSGVEPHQDRGMIGIGRARVIGVVGVVVVLGNVRGLHNEVRGHGKHVIDAAARHVQAHAVRHINCICVVRDRAGVRVGGLRRDVDQPRAPAARQHGAGDVPVADVAVVLVADAAKAFAHLDVLRQRHDEAVDLAVVHRNDSAGIVQTHVVLVFGRAVFKRGAVMHHDILQRAVVVVRHRAAPALRRVVRRVRRNIIKVHVFDHARGTHAREQSLDGVLVNGYLVALEVDRPGKRPVRAEDLPVHARDIIDDQIAAGGVAAHLQEVAQIADRPHDALRGKVNRVEQDLLVAPAVRFYRERTAEAPVGGEAGKLEYPIDGQGGVLRHVLPHGGYGFPLLLLDRAEVRGVGQGRVGVRLELVERHLPGAAL